jgi:hypothetical protein
MSPLVGRRVVWHGTARPATGKSAARPFSRFSQQLAAASGSIRGQMGREGEMYWQNAGTVAPSATDFDVPDRRTALIALPDTPE